MQVHFLLASLFTVVALGAEAEAGHEVDEEVVAAAKEDNSTQPYRPPNSDGIHWVESFDGDVMSRWTSSAKEKYNGKFAVEKRRQEGLIGDLGLLVPVEAQTYGISTSFPGLKGAKDVPFVLQFEAQFQDGLQCGGAYAKVFDRKGAKAEDFDNDTPYVIMFGPDRCGGTDKVHFILQHQNSKTGKWEEKHLKEPAHVPSDHLTHLYGLIINPDNTFEVQVDGVKKASGDLLTDMSPPINPPKDIDDPEDKKPEDWVMDPKMSDPESSKPDEWDEDEPASLPDPDAKMPDGWHEEVPETQKKIGDPSAKVPADWDVDEDGEWEPPVIDNPLCKVGCGKWNPPTISNPKYKGKWSAPKIDNPAYKGVWKPKQIANPDFVEDKAPCILPNVDSLGIDIWSMQGGILFDNFLISTDVAKAAAFVEETWRIRSNIEEVQKPKPVAGDGMWDMLTRYMIPLAVTLVVILLTTVWCCCFRGGSDVPPPAPRPAATKKKRDESPKPAEEKDPAEAEEKDDKKEEEPAEEDKKAS